MTNKMMAVVYHAPQDIRVEMIPVPSCGNDEIRVKIDACAVCGTDLKAYQHGNPRIKAPLVMGHEFTGIVEIVGKAVKGFGPGERIVMATSISCGACCYCQKGWPNLCNFLAPMGFSYPGGMAEYITIPARALANGHVIKVPESVRPEHAALAEPLSCAVNASRNCDVRRGDVVVIIGAGPMGIMNAWVARECGAKKIILAEVGGLRLKQAENFGFDVCLNPLDQDVKKTVMDETNGMGADVVMATAPVDKAQEQALEMARKRGIVCLFASLPTGKHMLLLDSRKIHYGEIRLVGTSDSTPAQVEKAVELLSRGTSFADNLVTHQLGLDGILETFDLMQNGEALKVVLKP